MSRVLKFRAWTGKYMIEADSCRWQSCNNSFGTVLMQFTGLFDKHKKPIFDGDIVKQEWDGYIGEVWFNVNAGRYYIDRNYDEEYNEKHHNAIQFHGQLEVVGNIYENEELLKNPELLKEDGWPLSHTARHKNRQSL